MDEYSTIKTLKVKMKVHLKNSEDKSSSFIMN